MLKVSFDNKNWYWKTFKYILKKIKCSRQALQSLNYPVSITIQAKKTLVRGYLSFNTMLFQRNKY